MKTVKTYPELMLGDLGVHPEHDPDELVPIHQLKNGWPDAREEPQPGGDEELSRASTLAILGISLGLCTLMMAFAVYGVVRLVAG